MINNNKINNWLNNPETLRVTRPNELENYAKEFPYFNIIQHLYALEQNEPIGSNMNARYQIHPVLRHILQAKYNNTYPKSFSYKIHENNETVPCDAKSNVESALSLDTEYLQIETPPQDYFRLEGINISDELPNVWDKSKPSKPPEENPKQSLMVVMPFSEWLKYLSKLSIKEKAEEESKKSLRALWQKEKLAIALEEETEEIPEEVFEMAVNSIAKQDDIVNESLAEVYVRQEKYQKAIDIYIKLSLLYPEKNTYFASKIEKLKKEL